MSKKDIEKPKHQDNAWSALTKIGLALADVSPLAALILPLSIGALALCIGNPTEMIKLLEKLVDNGNILKLIIFVLSIFLMYSGKIYWSQRKNYRNVIKHLGNRIRDLESRIGIENRISSTETAELIASIDEEEN
ncbi:MAG: hypothetical protein KC646_06920 [Candidatus Cloacimonetes bacterium]|nr:hypothetical protein [Candidatus Cloacimonadota bacterium]